MCSIPLTRPCYPNDNLQNFYTPGFHITFVNTEFNHRRLLCSKGRDTLKGLPDFRFETIPDGLPHSDQDATQDIPVLCYSIKRNCLGPLIDLVGRLNTMSYVPNVTCIVSDGLMSFGVQAAEMVGLPERNARYASANWEMGMEIHGNVQREDIEGIVRASPKVPHYLGIQCAT
ncbi:hypothetical protein GIB67_031378 [Kingdonia uniflora]|uniref:Uncharacterized protein n=1 Tax=Kingdonia uniflora TaxID=39325 RepID=A0A7J7MAY7_9MAGN|nr:hypothetical protein GIB67_031378 [Kingdonia uniflora]